MAGRYIGQFRPEFSRLYRDKDLAWIIPFHLSRAIALVGKRFSGKSTVASYLAERHGYRLVALGGILRDFARERAVDLEDRQALQSFGDQLRAENRDSAFLARLALRRVRRIQGLGQAPGFHGGVVVFTGVKHVAELEVIGSLPRFQLVNVEAPDEVRLARSIRTGVLERAYQAANPSAASLDSLSETKRKKALADLVDAPEDSGNDDGRWPEEYVASFSAIAKSDLIRKGTSLKNDSDDLAALHGECDRVLGQLAAPTLAT